MSHDTNHIEAHIRACLVVFFSLMVLTGITVWVSYLHVPTAAAITIALSIACVKGTLVLAYFMHLISEKKLIYYVLSLTAFFFVLALSLPLLTSIDVIKILVERPY